jgi:hypothetical protein
MPNEQCGIRAWPAAFFLRVKAQPASDDCADCPSLMDHAASGHSPGGLLAPDQGSDFAKHRPWIHMVTQHRARPWELARWWGPWMAEP